MGGVVCRVSRVVWQLGQTLGLLLKLELYTKADVARAFPALQTCLWRDSKSFPSSPSSSSSSTLEATIAGVVGLRDHLVRLARPRLCVAQTSTSTMMTMRTQATARASSKVLPRGGQRQTPQSSRLQQQQKKTKKKKKKEEAGCERVDRLAADHRPREEEEATGRSEEVERLDYLYLGELLSGEQAAAAAAAAAAGEGAGS